MRDIEKIINEIVKKIDKHLKLMINDEQYLIDLKAYCNHEFSEYFEDDVDLIYFFEDAISDLMYAGGLYDFKEVE